jgi:hypothetical protein
MGANLAIPPKSEKQFVAMPIIECINTKVKPYNLCELQTHRFVSLFLVKHSRSFKFYTSAWMSIW